jgi:hypothetical protein
MRLRKIGIALLALLLAAIAMVPMVSAANRPMYGVDWSRVAPTAPVDETELLTIIISENDFSSWSPEKDGAFIQMPAVDNRQCAGTTESADGYIIRGNVADSEKIVVLQLPKKMFERLSQDSKDGILLVPKEFFAHYTSIADFKKTSSERLASLKKSYEGNYTAEKPEVTDLGSAGTRAPYTRYQRWQVFSSDSSPYSPVFVSGKINPSTFSRTGSGTIFCEERELHMNRYDADSDGIDVIEMVVGAYTPGYPSGSTSNLNLYPVIYNADINGDPIYLGYIPVSTSSLPHSYNYYVQLTPASGSMTYDIWIQDTATETWLAYYTYTDSVNPSAYIRDVRVSAEFTTVNSASTFNIQTNPITDEWLLVSEDSSWHTPSEVFSYQRLIENHPGQMLYASTTGSFLSNGQLRTTSGIQGTTP